jgi:hypothetical protein
MTAVEQSREHQQAVDSEGWFFWSVDHAGGLRIGH